MLEADLGGVKSTVQRTAPRAVGFALLLLAHFGCSDAFQSCGDTRSCPPSGSGGHETRDATSPVEAAASPTSKIDGSTARDGAAETRGVGGASARDAGHATDASALADSSSPASDAAFARGCGNGFVDCNGKASDGCEADLETDPDHCGSCDFVCSAAGVTTRGCDHGICEPDCFGPNADCNASDNDGCESNTDTDPDNCGRCHHRCSTAGTVSRSCDQGSCQIPVCDGDHADCNQNGDDGCEIDLETDPDHCGQCDIVCAADGTTARACVDGQCAPTCDGAHLNCNGNGRDGCEVDLQTDPDSCGGCGFTCSTAGVSKRVCTAGVCKPVCSTGFGDCKKGSVANDDGCETDLTLASNCGVCNHDCLGGACGSEKCQPVTLGSSLETPQAVTIDAKYVHWLDGGSTDGRVVRSGLLGGGGTPVATSQAEPTAIISDGQYVYWTNQSGAAPAIRRIPSGGATLVTVADNSFSDVQAPGPLAMDADYLYFGDSIGRKILRIDKLGAGPVAAVTPSTLATNPISLVIDSTNAYFVWYGGMGRAPIYSSGVTATIPGGTNTQTIALDTTYLYFFTYSNATSLYTISRLPKTLTGTAQTVISLSDVGTKALAVDATYVYYTSSTGLYRVPKAGGVAQLLSSNVLDTVDIKLTSNAIYWVNQGDIDGTDGSVMKIAL